MRTTANDRGRGALLLPRACAGTHRLTETATGLAERGQRWAEAQEQATYVSGNLAVLLALMWLTCACILQIRYVQGRRRGRTGRSTPRGSCCSRRTLFGRAPSAASTGGSP